MFITFEGIDGTGKSTQIGFLEEFLNGNKIPYLSIREPGGTDFSEKVREILLSTKSEISSIAELMLFEAARADLCEKVIQPALDKGIVVISDRFYDSTTAYQGYGRGLDINTIQKCNQFATQNVIPDFTFYFRLPLEESINRRNYREFDRMELAGMEFFGKVINGFEELAKQEPERIIIIDAHKSREEIFEEILSKIKSGINEFGCYSCECRNPGN
ncbi:MAG: dTMP kinase [Ignavibacteria bacterium GWF2_33_9]|nr:MAG: dTMP kinase [Ignavibacteria bacterium GWF2_33_9]